MFNKKKRSKEQIGLDITSVSLQADVKERMKVNIELEIFTNPNNENLHLIEDLVNKIGKIKL
ncbi:hypothetical protein [Companilactobacillus sp. DQM5]|uniref:hypothetical protein n=1 Tax=Companilactobacillus sp. DQM5 TaxID=3463359 RepID=UPI004058CFF0